VIAAYLADLSAELGRRGVRGNRRRRILAETEDHLLTDPDAVGRFGDASAIAQAFADDLGTRAALRAPLWAFTGLAVAGVFYSTIFVAWSGFGAASTRGVAVGAAGAFQTVASGRASWLGLLAAATLVLAPQAAFVSGLLALLRALRLRGRRSVPAAEVRTLRRRTVTAVGFGLASIGAVALFAQQLGPQLPGWSAGLFGWGVVGAVLSAVLLVASGAIGLRTANVRVAAAGAAGDIFDDLGPAVPAPLHGHPWAFAAAVSCGTGMLVWLAGVVASDPYDGALRGLAEGAACIAGFAVLGRFLALRT
jgi:hypothetical protein